MEKIWLKSYPKGIPETIDPDQFKSLVDLFQKSVKRFSCLPAFSNMGTTLTYHEIDQLSQAFGATLQQKFKVKKGDRVALMMPNLLQYPIALFALLRIGAIVVNVNPLYTSSELSFQLNDSGAETIIILENFAKTLQDVVSQTPVKNVVLTEIGDLFPGVKGPLINFIIRRVKKMVPAHSLQGAHQFKTLLKAGKGSQPEAVEINNEDTAFFQYTGGTTGVSKAAELSHRNLLANMLQAREWCRSNLKDGQEVVITALPLYHIFSMTANCLFFMSLGGCNCLITNPKDIPGFIKTLRKTHFTAITGVNTLFNALVNHKDFGKINFSQLKLSLGGGMAVQRDVAHKWESRTGCALIEAYGLTEASPAVTINPMTLETFNGAIGLPLPSTEVSIRDEKGKALNIEQEGELWVKGPQVMKGYWNKPEETKEVISKDGWLKTGDMAKLDKDGFVYIVGRIKDMILVSGFNVYPNEIEDVVTQMDGVKEAAAIGVPHSKSGEMVKLFVVKTDETLTEADIKAHCKKSLTSYKQPKTVEFRKELPTTNVGKVLHRALRDNK